MDYVHITLEPGPFISWPKLRDAIALALQPDRSAMTGVDAVAGLMRRVPSSNDEFPVQQALSSAHKDALTQALPDLPPFYAGMKPEEFEVFQEAHRNHPALRDFDVPYPYSMRALETDKQARSNLKKHYESLVNKALAEETITGVNRDEFSPLVIVDGKAQEVTLFTKLERSSVTNFLLGLGFIVKDTTPTPTPTPNPTPTPELDIQESTPTRQRVHERVILVARALDRTELEKRDDPYQIRANLILIIEEEAETILCFRLIGKDGAKFIEHSGTIKSGSGMKAGKVFTLKQLEQTLKTVKKHRDRDPVAFQPQ